MSDGRVYLVGAGPGDPGLITVRGRELLQQADVILYDALASPKLLDYAPGNAEMIHVGKKAGAHTMPQEKINELLVDLARDGRQVVRLKGGDPYVFGRGGEEALALLAGGVPFEVVPGVTAGVAAVAYAGIPITHRNLASSVAFITGHESPDKSESALDYEVLAKWPGTLVFYMGVKNLRHICGSLVAHGMAAETPAAIIRWGTMPGQETLVATLTDIADKVDAAGEKMKPPALIVIGQVVALRNQLNWFEKRPLFSRRIVVTRARTQASKLTDLLTAQGADVTELPTIRIEPPADAGPLAEAVRSLKSFDWIIFTSANAVDAFFAALDEAALDSRALAATKICVVGPATAQRLSNFALRPDMQPRTYTGKDVCAVLTSSQNLKDATVLYPHADIAPPDLSDSLTAAGAAVTDCVAYRTVAESIAPEQSDTLLALGGVDWITFTSSSTVTNFLKVVTAEKLRDSSARLASIGPSTTQAIRDAGLEPSVEAQPHTMAGIVEAIIVFDRAGKQSQ